MKRAERRRARIVGSSGPVPRRFVCLESSRAALWSAIQARRLLDPSGATAVRLPCRCVAWKGTVATSFSISSIGGSPCVCESPPRMIADSHYADTRLDQKRLARAGRSAIEPGVHSLKGQDHIFPHGSGVPKRTATIPARSQSAMRKTISPRLATDCLGFNSDLIA